MRERQLRQKRQLALNLYEELQEKARVMAAILTGTARNAIDQRSAMLHQAWRQSGRRLRRQMVENIALLKRLQILPENAWTEWKRLKAADMEAMRMMEEKRVRDWQR